MTKFKKNFNSFITTTYTCDICNTNIDIQINKGTKRKQSENIILWCYKCKKYTNHIPIDYEEKIKVLKLDK